MIHAVFVDNRAVCVLDPGNWAFWPMREEWVVHEANGHRPHFMRQNVRGIFSVRAREGTIDTLVDLAVRGMLSFSIEEVEDIGRMEDMKTIAAFSGCGVVKDQDFQDYLIHKNRVQYGLSQARLCVVRFTCDQTYWWEDPEPLCEVV